jgi:hypothetical protein
MFRGAYRERRCLVPVDGWYEWQKHSDGRKEAHAFASQDEHPGLCRPLGERALARRGGPPHLRHRHHGAQRRGGRDPYRVTSRLESSISAASWSVGSAKSAAHLNRNGRGCALSDRGSRCCPACWSSDAPNMCTSTVHGPIGATRSRALGLGLRSFGGRRFLPFQRNQESQRRNGE